MKSTLGSWNFS